MNPMDLSRQSFHRVGVDTTSFTTNLTAGNFGPRSQQLRVAAAAPVIEPEVEPPPVIEPPKPAPRPNRPPAPAPIIIPAPHEVPQPGRHPGPSRPIQPGVCPIGDQEKED